MKTISFYLLTFSLLFIQLSCNNSNNDQNVTDTTASVQDTVSEDKNEVSLQLKWSTDTSLTTSESVLYHKGANVLYVSNINGNPEKKDKNGFISKVSLDGKIENVNWLTGLNAPKGMGLSNGKLYVTDITALVEIDTEKGKIIKKHEVPGAKFLNDVTVGEDSTIYFSDSYTGKIHSFKNGKISVWKEGFKGPNGLLALGNKLYLASGDSTFRGIDLSTKTDSVIATGIGHGDGVVSTGKAGEFIVSNWHGEVFIILDGQAKKILDTKDQKLNTADIEFVADQNLLLVPTFAGNAVQAYEVKK